MASIFLDYLKWHFTDAVSNLATIAGNYLHAANYKFLILRHFKTLFYPWHRRQPSDLIKGRFRNPGQKILDGIVDFYIRILAAIVRLIIILIGLSVQVATVLFFSVLIIFWILWPGISVFFVINGISLLLK